MMHAPFAYTFFASASRYLYFRPNSLCLMRTKSIPAPQTKPLPTALCHRQRLTRPVSSTEQTLLSSVDTEKFKDWLFYCWCLIWLNQFYRGSWRFDASKKCSCRVVVTWRRALCECWASDHGSNFGHVLLISSRVFCVRHSTDPEWRYFLSYVCESGIFYSIWKAGRKQPLPVYPVFWNLQTRRAGTRSSALLQR